MRQEVQCAICGDEGQLEVGTGYANSEGGELTEVVECECCRSDRRSFEEFEATEAGAFDSNYRKF